MSEAKVVIGKSILEEMYAFKESVINSNREYILIELPKTAFSIKYDYCSGIGKCSAVEHAGFAIFRKDDEGTLIVTVAIESEFNGERHGLFYKTMRHTGCTSDSSKDPFHMDKNYHVEVVLDESISKFAVVFAPNEKDDNSDENVIIIKKPGSEPKERAVASLSDRFRGNAPIYTTNDPLDVVEGYFSTFYDRKIKYPEYFGVNYNKEHIEFRRTLNMLKDAPNPYEDAPHKAKMSFNAKVLISKDSSWRGGKDKYTLALIVTSTDISNNHKPGISNFQLVSITSGEDLLNLPDDKYIKVNLDANYALDKWSVEDGIYHDVIIYPEEDDGNIVPDQYLYNPNKHLPIRQACDDNNYLDPKDVQNLADYEERVKENERKQKERDEAKEKEKEQRKADNNARIRDVSMLTRPTTKFNIPEDGDPVEIVNNMRKLLKTNPFLSVSSASTKKAQDAAGESK